MRTFPESTESRPGAAEFSRSGAGPGTKGWKKRSGRVRGAGMALGGLGASGLLQQIRRGAMGAPDDPSTAAGVGM